MAEATVTVGDTDVEIHETDDGFEAVEAEEEGVIVFTSSEDCELRLPRDADFEILASGHDATRNDFVVGFEDGAPVECRGNTNDEEGFSGSWRRNWYFVDMHLEE